MTDNTKTTYAGKLAAIETTHLPPSININPFDRTHEAKAALSTQVGGNHYSKLKIQPVEFIHANNIPFIEGCIIKYATRWRDKGGIKDLEKIKHFVDLLIELEGKAK
jgi:hypothetical protein